MSQKILIRMTAVLMTIAVVFSCVLTVGIKGSSVRPVEKQYATTLFQKDQIMEVNILIDEDDWQDMLDNASDETYIPCDVEVNGVTYKNVAIRPKGNTSLSQVTNDRYSFKIQFDKYQDGQTCDGLDQLILNNNFSDATYMKEYLAYDMFQYMGVVTPLYSYADVKVNGETYGLYLALEGVKEAFAERNYGTSHGELYKPESTQAGGGGGGARADRSNEEQKRPDRDQTTDGDNVESTDNKEADAGNTQNVNEGVSINTESSNDMSQNESDKTNTGDNTSSSSSENDMTPPDGNNMPSPPSGQGNSQDNRTNPMERGGGMESSSGSGTDLVYTDDDPDSYSDVFDSAVFDVTTETQKRLIAALKGISTGENLTDYMDVEATLKYFAVNSFLVNYDSYTGNLKHNYYLYENDGILTMLPWDLNLAFAGYQSNDATSAVNDPIDTPVSGTTLEERPMIGQLLSNETYMEEYHEYIDQLVTGYVESGRYEVVITQLKELISEYVKNDPTAFYTYDEYVEAVENLESFIELRGESVRGQLDGTIPSTEEAQKENSDSLIDAGDLSITAMGTMGGGMNHNKDGSGNFGPGNGGFGNNTSNNDGINVPGNTENNRSSNIQNNTQDSTSDNEENNTASNTVSSVTRKAASSLSIESTDGNTQMGTGDGSSQGTPPSGTGDGNFQGTPPSGTGDGNFQGTPPSGTGDGNVQGAPPGGNEDGNSVETPSTENMDGNSSTENTNGDSQNNTSTDSTNTGSASSTTSDANSNTTDDTSSASVEQGQMDSNSNEQNMKNNFPNGDMTDKMNPGNLGSQDNTKQVVMIASGSVLAMVIMCILMWKLPRRKYRS